MKIGFDNQKYLSMQSEHIRERISQFDCTWNSEASCLTTSMPPGCCPASPRTVNSRC